MVSEKFGESDFLNECGTPMFCWKYDLKDVFGYARMYYGSAATIDWNRIYGITTFELG
jgi:hypothetical protein